MLWNHYVFRRGPDVHDMWDTLFADRVVRLLYVGGRGFDTRAQTVMSEFVQNLQTTGARIEKAELLLVRFTSYHLDDALRQQTEVNTEAATKTFEALGGSRTVSIGPAAAGEDDLTATNALRLGTDEVLAAVFWRDLANVDAARSGKI